MFLRKQECVDQIIDKENVAHLHAVAVDRDGLAGNGTNHEMRHPTLIFVSILVRTVDATHAKDERGNPVSARVIDDVLVCCAFRTTVGAVKIEWPVLADTSLTYR